MHGGMYGVEPMFWGKLIVLLTIMTLLILIFHIIMRKWLKIKKRGFFSSNIVNEKHKKIDWIIRIVFIVLMILGSIINVKMEPMERIWFLEPWYLLFFLIVSTEIVRAFMERKYSDDKNAYLLTVSQLVFIVVVFIIVLRISPFFF